MGDIVESRQEPGVLCFVTADFAGLGRDSAIGAHFSLMSRLLAKRGWEVHVLYCGDVEDEGRTRDVAAELTREGIAFTLLEDLRESPGARIRHYGGDADTLVLGERALEALEALHAEHGFDFVEFPDRGALGLRSIQARAAGDGLHDLPLAVRLHGPTRWWREGNLQLISAPRELKLEFCERYAFERADLQVSASRYMLDYTRKLDWGVRDDAVVANPYPDPPTEPATQGPDISELVFFGRLERRTGLHLFLDALDNSVERDVPVLFLGEDTLIDGFPASELIGGRMGDRPYRIETDLDRNDALAELSRGDRLAVLPSLSESCGFTVAECVVNRIPFLAARVGGLRRFSTMPRAASGGSSSPPPKGCGTRSPVV